jgi:hypothetical protein
MTLLNMISVRYRIRYTEAVIKGTFVCGTCQQVASFTEFLQGHASYFLTQYCVRCQYHNYLNSICGGIYTDKTYNRRVALGPISKHNKPPKWF